MGAKCCCLVPCNESYSGSWRGIQKHGSGQYTYADKSVYKGSFVQNFPEGEGSLFSPASGLTYIGSFKRGLKHGDGVLTHTSGLTYVGTFVAGQKSGKGCLTYPDGSTFSGSFLRDLPHGSGTLTKKDGTIYAGSFRAGLFHGSGKLSQGNSGDSITCATWIDGVPEGEGEIQRFSGDLVRGKFVRGIMRGKGEIKRRRKGGGGGSEGRGGGGNARRICRHKRQSTPPDQQSQPPTSQPPQSSPPVTATQPAQPVSNQQPSMKPSANATSNQPSHHHHQQQQSPQLQEQEIEQHPPLSLVSLLHSDSASPPSIRPSCSSPPRSSFASLYSSIYRGELFDGFASGSGSITFENGDVYEGVWERDVVKGENEKGKYIYAVGLGPGTGTGNGTANPPPSQLSSLSPSPSPLQIFPSRSVYIGQVNSNYEPHGQNGCMYYTNGDVYTGQWFNGMRQGKGEGHYANQDKNETNTTGIESGSDVPNSSNNRDTVAPSSPPIINDALPTTVATSSPPLNTNDSTVATAATSSLIISVPSSPLSLLSLPDPGSTAVSPAATSTTSSPTNKITTSNANNTNTATSTSASPSPAPSASTTTTATANSLHPLPFPVHYSGQWLADLPHGQGRCKYVDGSVYIGEWKSGQRWGSGSLYYEPVQDTWDGRSNSGSVIRLSQISRTVLSHPHHQHYHHHPLLPSSELDHMDVYQGEFIADRIRFPYSSLRLAPFRLLSLHLSRLSSTLSALRFAVTSIDPETACKLCGIRVINTLMLECAHRSVCSECAGLESGNGSHSSRNGTISIGGTTGGGGGGVGGMGMRAAVIAATAALEMEQSMARAQLDAASLPGTISVAQSGSAMTTTSTSTTSATFAGSGAGSGATAGTDTNVSVHLNAMRTTTPIAPAVALLPSLKPLNLFQSSGSVSNLTNKLTAPLTHCPVCKAKVVKIIKTIEA